MLLRKFLWYFLYLCWDEPITAHQVRQRVGKMSKFAKCSHLE